MLLSPLFGREITSAWAVNAGNLNPHLYSPNQMYAQIMLYQSLVRFDGEKFIGEVAKSWEVSKDGKTYTFFLKDNLVFSDGSPHVNSEHSVYRMYVFAVHQFSQSGLYGCSDHNRYFHACG